MLERIGEPIGAGPIDSANAFLEIAVQGKTEGGWVVIGAALREQLGRDMPGAVNRARDAIMAAQVWYASDIIGERVPGQALVENFDAALEQLNPWRWDYLQLGTAVCRSGGAYVGQAFSRRGRTAAQSGDPDGFPGAVDAGLGYGRCERYRLGIEDPG